MPLSARLYAGVAVALGLVVLAGCLAWYGQFPETARFLAYVSLACIGSTMKVRLPRLQGTISVNFLFVLLAAVQLSLAETLLLSLAATIVQCRWRAKTRPKLIQVSFNASTVVISAALAYATAHAVPGDPQALTALIPAATVYFVVNTGMISLILALISNQPLHVVWRKCHLSAFPLYLVGAAIAAAASASSQTSGWRLSLLALPIMYLVYSHYRMYLSSQTTVAAG